MSNASRRHPIHRRHALAIAAAAVLGPLSAVPAAAAAVCTWDTTNGNWNAIVNWANCVAGNGNPGGTPGSNDTANIGVNGVVTIDSAQSVRNLNNEGQINLDAFSLTLVGGGSTVNTGFINVGSATAAALQVSSGHNIDNAAGVINVADGSVVNQFGSTISGGTINTTGSGALVAKANSNNFLDATTLNGTLDLASAQGFERVTNGLVLNGSVNIGANSIFAPEGDNTISGSGSIVFADSNGLNYFDAGAGNLTLGSGITVRGDTGKIGGQYFAPGAATLTNQGLISADVSGGTITVDVNGGVTNQGTMEAKNGGTLWLNGNGPGITNSGTLRADADSAVVFYGTTVSGGTLEGSGRFVGKASSNNFLVGVTLNGTLDLASAQGFERVKGGMTLNGTVNIGKNSIFAPEGDNTISGSGSIVFADSNGFNYFDAGAGNLTLGSGITVRGDTGKIGGQYFAPGAATLTNNGTINADGGGTITVAVNGLTTNNGTLRAQDGTLTVSSALVNNGTLRADADGVVNLPANFANDGLMTGIGRFALSGTLANNGHMRPGTPGGEPGALTLDGNYAQGASGWFDVGLDGASFGSLAVSGSALLDGTIGVICEGMCDYAVGTSWIVMTTGGSNLVTGTFAGAVAMTGFESGAFSVTYYSNQVVLNVTEATVGVVPEPGTIALMLAGLLTVGFVAKRRRLA